MLKLAPPRFLHPLRSSLVWSKQVRNMSQFHAHEPVEEQSLPNYAMKRYYPVRIGDVLNSRYRVLAKLGFGAYSTVWLAHDQRLEKYASVKVCIQDDSDTSPIRNEIKILRHLAQSPQEHPGSKYARISEDMFEIEGPSGYHSCIASQPQGCSLWTLQGMFPEGRAPKEIVAHVVQRLLGCINWLFCDCDVIHTEITAQNVLMELNDDSSFLRIEEAQAADTSAPVLDGEYPVYRSRGEPVSMLELSCDPVLTDFGSSRSAKPENKGWWMPDTHRAPEVLLGLPWDAQVDVWSMGIMALELLEGRNLFDPIDKVHSQYVLPLAVAQYISYMGPPPRWMIEQSRNPVIRSFFDEQGNWIGERPIPSASLEDFVTAIEAGEEKEMFIKFIKKILVWDPAERGQSANLFSDPWLMGS